METNIWSWKESTVNVEKEYIEIAYGKIGNNEEIIPIARIGKPTGKVFPVEWIIQKSLEGRDKIIDECRKEISYYLVELNEKDAWAYACYHCSTASNLYSMFHWILHLSEENMGSLPTT